MKSKKRTKTTTRSKSTSHAKTRMSPRSPRKPKTSHATLEPKLNDNLLNTFKACQETEIGDIGGFGSTQELEEHQKNCSEPATEFCTNCGRNLCRNHYDMIHRDHDRNIGGSNTTTLA